MYVCRSMFSLPANSASSLREIRSEGGRIPKSIADVQVSRVIFVVFSARDEDVYRSIAPEYFPPT